MPILRQDPGLSRARKEVYLFHQGGRLVLCQRGLQDVSQDIPKPQLGLRTPPLKDAMNQTNLPNIKLLVALMVLSGVIILGVAVYVFTHLSGLDLRQAAVLIALGVVGLILIATVLAMFLRSLSPKK